ncbi:MAG: hypothetical protein AAF998_25605 [Bacteroidota bacterium]
MNIEALKLDIIQRISQTADQDLLESILSQLIDDEIAIGISNGKSFTRGDLKKDIAAAREDHAQGRTCDIQSVLAIVKSRYNQYPAQ